MWEIPEELRIAVLELRRLESRYNELYWSGQAARMEVVAKAIPVVKAEIDRLCIGMDKRLVGAVRI